MLFRTGFHTACIRWWGILRRNSAKRVQLVPVIVLPQIQWNVHVPTNVDFIELEKMPLTLFASLFFMISKCWRYCFEKLINAKVNLWWGSSQVLRIKQKQLKSKLKIIMSNGIVLTLWMRASEFRALLDNSWSFWARQEASKGVFLYFF